MLSNINAKREQELCGAMDKLKDQQVAALHARLPTKLQLLDAMQKLNTSYSYTDMKCYFVCKNV